MADANADKARPNRMSCQREKTNKRLVNAALSVMAEKGLDAATINDITEAADVGFGSFYNHFSSKERSWRQRSTRCSSGSDRKSMTP